MSLFANAEFLLSMFPPYSETPLHYSTVCCSYFFSKRCFDFNKISQFNFYGVRSFQLLFLNYFLFQNGIYVREVLKIEEIKTKYYKLLT